MDNKDQVKKDVQKFLSENVTAVIATSFNDEPRASTVYYYADEALDFYFVTKRNTGKYINIEMNPRAAVVVGTGPEHISVMANGEVNIVTDIEEQIRILGKMEELYKRENITNLPIEELQNFKDRNKVIFKITPKELIFMNLDSTSFPESHGDSFVQLIP
ncbi:MAG: pyridoxamine 5'-phosphate oxidase family protein [Patescibacteria group bacterium]